MDDASSAATLCDLAEAGRLGDFAVAYFADNDFRSHDVGPHAALPAVERVDAALGAMFDAAGGFERFTRDTCVIVTSDHGHCEVLADEARAAIRLERVLGDLRPADLTKGWRPRDEIMICPNLRAAQIYLRQPTPDTIDRLVRAALAEPRIDLVLWHSRVIAADAAIYVVESQRGRLEFWRGEEAGHHARDAYGGDWSWRGDLDALGLDVEGLVLESTEYPNAFERIAGALDAENSGEVWVTAQPGCEFEVPGGRAHVGGGSHGALHALDSLSLLIVGGAGAPALPRSMRAVDLAPLCANLLGFSIHHRVGDPR
jgi:hypothetical protein